MGLSRENILSVALALVDRQGIAKLSMRKLGAELGVEAMSLYNHVKNKEDLLNGIHEAVLAEIPQVTVGDSWAEQAREMARNARSVLRSHPNAIELFASRPAITPGSLAYFDYGLGILREAGFSNAKSIAMFQCIYSYVVGHVQFFIAREVASAVSEQLYGSLPPETFPHLVSSRIELANRDVDAEFEFGLGSLLAGFEITEAKKAAPAAKYFGRG